MLPFVQDAQINRMHSFVRLAFSRDDVAVSVQQIFERGYTESLPDVLAVRLTEEFVAKNRKRNDRVLRHPRFGVNLTDHAHRRGDCPD